MRRLAALALLFPLAGCGGPANGDTTLTVLAAASLSRVFDELAVEFEQQHPGVDVRLAFDSSATLAQQTLEGAPVDVLATADQVTMDVAAPVVDEPEVFATNTMVLVVPAANPAGIDSFADLDSDGVDYVACVETAPCGRVAAALLEGNGIGRAPASLDVDVRAVLARVVAGEADAGIVYASDAVSAGRGVTATAIPGAGDEVTTYPVATVTGSAQPELARDFVELVLSPTGQGLAAVAGFGKP